MKRGNETDKHIQMKTDIRDSLVFNGFVVKPEEHEADLVAYHPRLQGICACECELSTRNAIRNIRRDIARGANHVIVVADALPLKVQLLRKTRRKLRPPELAKVTVLCMADLRTRHIAQIAANALLWARKDK